MLMTSGAVDTGGSGCDVTAALCTKAVDSIVGDGAATAAKDWVLSRCNGVSGTCNESTWLVRLVLLVLLVRARLVDFGSADAVLESDPLVLGRAVAVDEPKDGVVDRDNDDSGVFCAPPVLTVTPGGADADVAPVETDTMLDVVVDPVAV
jgi:hypothetical protein